MFKKCLKSGGEKKKLFNSLGPLGHQFFPKKKNGLQTSSAMAAGVPWPFMARSAAWMVTSTCARGQRSGAWRAMVLLAKKKIRTDLIMESYLSHLESRFPCVYLSMGFNVSICLSIYIMLAIYTYLFTPSSIYLHILVYNRLYRQFEQDCVDTSVVFPIASRSPLPPGPEARGPRRLSCS